MRWNAYWRSRTHNKISTEPGNEETIQTLVTVDGLGRAIYTAKTGVRTDVTGNDDRGWNLSGAVSYDAKGRVVEQGQPAFSDELETPEPAAMKNATRTRYDILDRPVEVRLPDDSKLSTAYRIESGRMLTVSTDPEYRVTETLTDERGRVVELRKKYQSELKMKADYQYDILGQLREASVKDETQAGATSYTTRYRYDLRGLQTSLEAPDTGRVEMTYDDAGRMTKKVTPVLRETGKAINYQYDGLGRLEHITYPDADMNVSYQYGSSAAAAEYAAGRLLSRTDESGTIAYEYGKMGEVVGETRTLKRLNPLSTTREARIEYKSNYLGQMESVTYHDEEKISYEYDAGGQVIRVTGLREDDVTPTVFVERIGYDEFGQRSYLEYGNGDVTTYTYDEKRRWLTSLSTENQWGRNLQNLSYRFDDVGNVKERTDASDRYTSTQSYTYDGLYQLETAGGTYINKPSGHTSWTDTYSQTFTYDGLGNLERKVSTERRSPSASASPLNYDLSYTYDEERPHLATKIGELYYSYDANGNMTRESTLPGGQSSASQLPNLTTIGDVRRADQAFGFINEVEDDDHNEYIRTFSWDAENRLKTVLTSNGRSVRYLYDADGIRTTKYAGDGAYTEGLSGETLYYNQWWTETEDSGSFRRAKHIYVGQERIVTRLSNPAIGGSPYEDVNTYYYHPDHLGNAHSITDSEGNPYERIEYTPYGEMWIEIQEDDATESYNYIPFRFTGKEWDAETGLYYYGARYLDPKTSRWVSGDPAGFGLMNPMGTKGKLRQGYSIVEATNWYSYTSNNPVRYTDPTGMVEDDVFSGNTGSTEQQVAAQQEYEAILSQGGHDPDRREKLLDNLYERNPGFNGDFARAQEGGPEALQVLFEENFPGFEYNSNGAPLVTQIDCFLQGEPTPSSVGFSFTILGLGKGFFVTNSGSIEAPTIYSPLTLIGGSFDLVFGSGLETSLGANKHLSVGLLFRENYKGDVAVGGVAIHLGYAAGSPVNVSGTVGGRTLYDPSN